MNIVIIGAGLGGLSAACHIAGIPGNHRVTVIDRNQVPGGRAGLWSEQGYHVDPGPVVLTMPEYIDDAFCAAGSSLTEHLSLIELDPMYRGHFHDGTTLDVKPGREAMTAEIARVCGSHEAAQFGRFCDWLRKLYEAELPNFIDRNFNSVVDLARPLGPGLQLIRLGGFAKLHNLVAKHFADERLHRMFSFQALYAGLAPKQALGAYAVITYMDSVLGVTFPKGGMHAVARGLADAAAHAGVNFRYDTEVVQIHRHAGSGAVTGVQLSDGERLAADTVVVNADVPVAYRSLLPDVPMPRVLAKGHYSPSCALWLAGIRGARPAGLAHHNIVFGERWHESFEELLDSGRQMTDPSRLITIPSVTDPALAPDSSNVVYALEPIPNLKTGTIDWSRQGDVIRQGLIDQVRALGLHGTIEVQRFIDPHDWAAMGMEAGTPFALSHRFLQTGPFRAKNIDARVPGLVFTGSSTVPGVGVPMVILSGKLAAQRVRQWTKMVA
jgi:phytoene desaturase